MLALWALRGVGTAAQDAYARVCNHRSALPTVPTSWSRAMESMVKRALAAYQQQAARQPRCSTTPPLPPLVTAAELFGDVTTPSTPKEPPLAQRLALLFGYGDDR